jgi:hypothetical protein
MATPVFSLSYRLEPGNALKFFAAGTGAFGVPTCRSIPDFS